MQRKILPLDLFEAKKHLELIAIKALSVRDRFESEIRTRLIREFTMNKMDVRFDLIDEVIEKLKSQKYLRDEELVVKSALHLLDEGKGPYFIKAKLQSLGVSDSLIRIGLTSLTPESIQTSLQGIINKKKPIPKDKLIRFLMTRGFSYSDIKGSID